MSFVSRVALLELYRHTVRVVHIEAATAVRFASHDRAEVVASVGRECSMGRIDVVDLEAQMQPAYGGVTGAPWPAATVITHELQTDGAEAQHRCFDDGVGVLGQCLEPRVVGDRVTPFELHAHDVAVE